MRFLTAIVLIGLCGFALARGWGIAHFSLALANISSSEKRAEIVHRWTSAPVIASAALTVELTEKIDGSDPTAANRRQELLASILSIKPLSSFDWLSLSIIQRVTNQPMERVLGSLKLSMVTGPNEGNLMADRGTFGVSIWDSLSSDLQSHAATDLITADLSQNRKIRTVLSAVPERVRNEVRGSLLASGFPPKEIEQRLGF